MGGGLVEAGPSSTRTMSPDRALPAPDSEWRRQVLALDETYHPKVRQLAVNMEWWIRACIRNNRDNGYWFVVAGPEGVGKTHCARRAHQYILERQIDAYHRGWLTDSSLHSPALLRWDLVADGDDADFRYTMDNEVAPARAVIIDDVGAETDRYRSAVPMARLKAVLDMADDCNKWLLVTTNIARPDWPERFGIRVAGRLGSEGAKQRTRYLTLFGVPSYRAHGSTPSTPS